MFSVVPLITPAQEANSQNCLVFMIYLCKIRQFIGLEEK